MSILIPKCLTTSGKGILVYGLTYSGKRLRSDDTDRLCIGLVNDNRISFKPNKGSVV